MKPEVPLIRTGKKVAVIGSGPSGLACAQQLAREGHLVTVFEKNDRAGGLMALGIPDFKLEKPLIDRRLEQMKGEVSPLSSAPRSVPISLTKAFTPSRRK